MRKVLALAGAGLALTWASIGVAQFARGPSPEEIARAEQAKTPRTADGRPDLAGYWGNAPEFGSGKNNVSADGKKVEFDILPPFAPRAGGAGRGAGRGGGAPAGAGRGTANGAPVAEATPSYKPELQAKVKQLAVTDVDTDSTFTCAPPGVPRAGLPNEIFQSRDALVFLYETLTGDYRIIKTDGRKHNPNLDPSYYGDSLGRWEGDTLVIESTNFADDSWLAGGGYFHSDQLRVTERLTRKGNALTYDVTVEDPVVLTKPWIQPTKRTVLGKSGSHVLEAPPCRDQDREHMVDKTHITP